MSDDLVKRLEAEKALEETSPRGCVQAMPVYPCAENCPCALRDKVISQAARIRELEAELAALREARGSISDHAYSSIYNQGFEAGKFSAREARGAGSLDRELAYQNYINEPTPNGNTRMDNILGCIAPCPAKVERHVATQIDRAFQAGWQAALTAIEPSPVTPAEAARALLDDHDEMLELAIQTMRNNRLINGKRIGYLPALTAALRVPRGCRGGGVNERPVLLTGSCGLLGCRVAVLALHLVALLSRAPSWPHHPRRLTHAPAHQRPPRRRTARRR